MHIICNLINYQMKNCYLNILVLFVKIQNIVSLRINVYNCYLLIKKYITMIHFTVILRDKT